MTSPTLMYSSPRYILMRIHCTLFMRHRQHPVTPSALTYSTKKFIVIPKKELATATFSKFRFLGAFALSSSTVSNVRDFVREHFSAYFI